jgi:hypothetical protein
MGQAAKSLFVFALYKISGAIDCWKSLMCCLLLKNDVAYNKKDNVFGALFS